MNDEILNNLKISLSDLQEKIQDIIYTSNYYFGLTEPFKPYNSYWKYNKEKDKYRKIEAPHVVRLRYCLKPIAKVLKNAFEKPVYCMSCWKGTNNILNASIHAGKRFTITLDIANYFPSTKSIYVENFWKSLGFHGEDLIRLMHLTTFDSHLPTGAPTSDILAALIHKPLFDVINKKMQKQGITFTVYFDDITLSSDKHISNGIIKFIGKVLKTHGLRLKFSKIKRFGYKGAVITGVKTTQSGKLRMLNRQGHKVIKMLNEKSIENMNEKELKKIIGKIGYIQQINRDGRIKSKNLPIDKNKSNRPYFYITKQEAFKRLNKITKHS